MMFERFTKEARNAVVAAQREGRELGHDTIGPQHLLLALAADDGPAGRVLREHGIRASSLRAHVVRGAGDPLDPDALRAIGIDLDEVRQATEQSFGEGALDVPAGRFRRGRGHIPFTRDAKKALELSLRHAIRLKHKEINSGHLLLGVLHDERFASVTTLAAAGVSVETLRDDVTGELASDAA
ncbi:Clp protease N-terminal domain-containing protein [Spirillospora sp. CA-294931]|uniref:Clp protease N-terminal domain-containing protein n=1 Tax=Spirillospora sp. CA-294931 TaxID=3240042 RepID=UPI003D8FCB28